MTSKKLTCWLMVYESCSSIAFYLWSKWTGPNKVFSRCRLRHVPVTEPYLTSEPAHVKSNEMACAPREDSNQSGHQPSLIMVFAVLMKKS